MSTLSYLDERNKVSYSYVGWKDLNNWLSGLNSEGKVGKVPPKGVNRGKIIQELDERRKKMKNRFGKDMVVRQIARIDRGHRNDWCDYENDHGYTHLEELLIYQPVEWRNQAREYIYQFRFDVERESSSPMRCTEWNTVINMTEYEVPVIMWSPILVALFHPDMKRSKRYEPLNFILAYTGSCSLMDDLLPKYIGYFLSQDKSSTAFKKKIERDFSRVLVEIKSYDVNSRTQHQTYAELLQKLYLELSPLDYFFYFQESTETYSLETLIEIGKNTGVPRLWLMKELDFSLVIGQRVAKHLIREEVVTHLWNRSNNKDEICSNFNQPISMIFAGPSGNGMSKLLNKPEEDAFHKVDCGKLTSGHEIFGSSGPYLGSEEGSALNNFICRMSAENSIGVVLLDEIEKADKSVIHGLYQVLDKGEWTNKRLEKGKSHTKVISCRNIVFVMTTNAADKAIEKFGSFQDMYTADIDDLEDAIDEMSFMVQKLLQFRPPFTEAFIGRVGKVVPFLPMGIDEGNHEPLSNEMMTVAKLLIEREEERVTGGKKDIHMKLNISPETKENMASIIVRRTVPESGVRGIQKEVRKRVSKKLLHKCALVKEKGGIGNGSSLTFSADRQKNRISFRENYNSLGGYQKFNEDDDTNYLSECDDTNFPPSSTSVTP